MGEALLISRASRAFRASGPRCLGAGAALASLLAAAPVLASERAATDPTAALRAEIEALRAEYERRSDELERRVAELEGGPGPAPAPAEDELTALRREAAERAAAGEPEAPPAEREPDVGRERNLNRLNPEISTTGIVLATGGDGRREEFDAQEFEIDLQAALDPFSRTRFTLALGEEGVELEEGWVAWSSLPGGLGLTAGKFRQRFGPLNRQHLHALPQSDFPLVHQAFFGDEGLAQTGLSFAWLLPRPWASANELVLEVTDGENEVAFAGEEFEDLAVLARLKNFWELSAATYVEWGLSGVAGNDAEDETSRVYGTDLTVSWQPPGRAKYRGFEWRTEVLVAERGASDAWGGYTYGEAIVRRNLSAGLRLDRVEDLFDDRAYTWGAVPYLTWWQSEYVRLRAEYGFARREPEGRREDRFTLQLTWAAGPHKHESY